MANLSDELIPTRATLLLRLKDWQDQSSWQEFFDIYAKLIYGVAIKHGLTKVEAQDVVQETMFAVARHIPAFKYDPSIGSFKAWLLNMTRWRMADQLRKRIPTEAPSDSCDQTDTSREAVKMKMPSPCSDWEKIWDAEWEKNLLDTATAKARRHLDPKQYQIFDFCVHKEWPPDKIAKLFSISTDQVYLAKHRVTKKIKREVERLRKEMI